MRKKDAVFTFNWDLFLFDAYQHNDGVASFEMSHLWRWPRRSCESLLYPMMQGTPYEDFPLSSTDSLIELQESIKQIAKYE